MRKKILGILELKQNRNISLIKDVLKRFLKKNDLLLNYCVKLLNY